MSGEKIVLVGNPNAGKTSLFNSLTGLRQKVGNYPGITVDRKRGVYKGAENDEATLIDLPGTYSIHSSSKDEEVVLSTLLNKNHADYPDKVVVVADATHLKRHLFLATQLLDLGLPTLLVLNMKDELDKRKMSIDLNRLEQELGVNCLLISTKTGEGMQALKKALSLPFKTTSKRFFSTPEKYGEVERYRDWVLMAQDHLPDFCETHEKTATLRNEAKPNRLRIDESVLRYQKINTFIDEVVDENKKEENQLTEKIDGVVMHPVVGPLIFMGLLFLMFQAIYSWASVPMDLIDESFAGLSDLIKGVLPEGPFTDLVSDGILPGIGGVVIFIPQIAILFAFLALLEESGYMARVVFLMDKLMSKVGLSGKSIVPLLSGVACAIPAVMAARNIEDWKQRLITILVTPFMTCSARIPVYTILIAVIIPDKQIGFLNLQGLVLMGMYLLGLVVALLSSLLLHWILKTKQKSFFIMEMPVYQMPEWRNVGLTILEKTKAFVFNAGKVILAVSIVLWALASYGPGDALEKAEEGVVRKVTQNKISVEEQEQFVAAAKMEASYLGIFGKVLEPAIRPLGYDWKMGIALIASISAREVFVGTLATIYSVGDTENELTIKERLLQERNPVTGQLVYNFATGISLLLFYAFAMQCISTIAIVKRETGGWKWPGIQFVSMTLLAYVVSLIAYQSLI